MKYDPKLLIVLLILIVISPLPGNAQVPELINYQGRLVDGGGLVSGDREVVLRLENTGGTELYAETQNVTIVDGLYTYCLGASNASPGALVSALMNTGVWLEVEVDGSTLSPRAQFKAVGYAVKAAGVEDDAITTAMLARHSGQALFNA